MDNRPAQRNLQSCWRSWLAVLLFVPLLASCTKEKAEALKVAASKLRDEVSQSMVKVRQLYRLELATYLPDDYVHAELKKDAGKGSFTDGKLDELMAETRIDDRRNAVIDRNLEEVNRQFALFASMFDNLPAGYLFATESVNQSLKVSANLTLNLASLTKNLQRHTTLGRDNRKRASLVDQIGRAYAVTDVSVRDGILKGLSAQVETLRDEEQQNRQAMFASLARATLASETVTELIRDYGKLDAADILVLIREALALGTAISGGSINAADALARVDSIEAKLRNDPMIAPLLDIPLSK
jgi:hypothetical protein